MALVGLAIEEGSDTHCDLDAGAALAANTLSAELLRIAGSGMSRRALLVLELVRKLLGLTEADLSLEAIVVCLLMHHSLLLLLKAV